MNSLQEEKLFYERFFALLNNRDLMTVFEKYGPSAFRRSSVLEGFEQFIDGQRFSGKVCVEVGTLNGLTACLLARRFAHVVTVDIIDAPLKYEIAQMLGVKNIDFINVKDNIEKAERINSLEFDAAYLDGDHTHDTETDFALVKRGGRVLFHEHWDAQPAVVNLVKRLSAKRQGAQSIVTQGKLALWTA